MSITAAALLSFGCVGLERRRALWAAGAAAEGRADRLPGTVVGVSPPALPERVAVVELEVGAGTTRR